MSAFKYDEITRSGDENRGKESFFWYLSTYMVVPHYTGAIDPCVRGMNNVPPKPYSAIVVEQHTNAMMDGFTLMLYTPRYPTYFVARDSLWESGILRFFFDRLNVLPIRPARNSPHGQVVPAEDIRADNERVFEAITTTLSKPGGNLVAIYAEGMSHYFPKVMRLRSGFARAAFSVDSSVPLCILPVAASFTHNRFIDWDMDERYLFRSMHEVHFGRPLWITDKMRALYRVEPEKAIDELVARTTRRLKSYCAFNAVDWPTFVALQLARQLATPAGLWTDLPFWKHCDASRFLMSGYAELQGNRAVDQMVPRTQDNFSPVALERLREYDNLDAALQSIEPSQNPLLEDPESRTPHGPKHERLELVSRLHRMGQHLRTSRLRLRHVLVDDWKWRADWVQYSPIAACVLMTYYVGMFCMYSMLAGPAVVAWSGVWLAVVLSQKMEHKMLDTAMSRASMLLYVMVLPWTLGVAIFYYYFFEGVQFVHPVRAWISLLWPVLPIYLPATLVWLWGGTQMYESGIRHYMRFRGCWMIFWWPERYRLAEQLVKELQGPASDLVMEATGVGQHLSAQLDAEDPIPPWMEKGHSAYRHRSSAVLRRMLSRGFYGRYDAKNDVWMTMFPSSTFYFGAFLYFLLPVVLALLRCPLFMPAGLIPLYQWFGAPVLNHFWNAAH